MSSPNLCIATILLIFNCAFSATNIGKLLHLTDFHVDPDYTTAGRVSKFCHSDYGSTNTVIDSQKDTVAKYGDRRCDAPKTLLNFVLSEAKRIVGQPDLIIWTGDNTAHVPYNSTDYAIEQIEWASEAILRYFGPDIPVVPVLGNHDFAPANFVPDQPNELYERTLGIWQDWIGPNGRDTFRHGGYYKYRWMGQIFLVLNTNFYYIYNHQKMADSEDPAGQFAFLEMELEMAKKMGTKVHIIGHIAPGGKASESTHSPYQNKQTFEHELLLVMKRQYNDRLVDLMAKYANWTNLLIFGHLHTDTFRIIKDKNGKIVQSLFLSAAVSPFKTNNPAFRLFEWDMDKMEIEDIKTYFSDLDELNKNDGPSEMLLEYSMRDAYGLRSFSPEAFGELVERLKTDHKMFRDYIRFNSVQSNATMPSEWERVLHLCAIEFVQHEDYLRCLKEYEMANGGRAFSIDFLIFIFNLYCSIFIKITLF